MKPSSSPSSALGNLLEDVHLAKLFSLFLNRLRAANRGRRVKVCAAIKPPRASIVLGSLRPLLLRKGGGASSITQSMPGRRQSMVTMYILSKHQGPFHALIVTHRIVGDGQPAPGAAAGVPGMASLCGMDDGPNTILLLPQA